jgi:hypothetical protein
MLARLCLASLAIIAAWSPAAAGPAPAPTAAGCVIAAGGWSGPRLLLRPPRGRPFATVTAGDLTLRTADRVSLEVAVLGVRLDTAPRPADVPLFLRSRTVVGGVVKTGPGTALLWRPRGDGLRLALPADRRIRFAAAPFLDVACADVQLQGWWGRWREPLPSGGGSWVQIAGEREGKPAASIRLPSADAVEMVERVGRRARIEWYLADGPLADATVVGWIDAADVPPPSVMGGLIGVIGGLSGGESEGTSDVRGCSVEHPLLVATSAGREAIGVILPGTRVTVRGRPRGGFATVNLIGPSVVETPPALRLRPGARWVMAAADAADCR